MDFERGQIFVFIGKQHSGKSYTLRNLMYQFSKAGIFKFGKVFSGTSFNSDYDWVPEGAIDSNYTEAKLEAYIGKLRKWLEDHPGKKLPPSFLILDDLLGKMKANTSIFSSLMSTYRHYNLSIFITSQYMVKNISTLLRELTDYAFIYKTKFKNTRESLYSAFGQMFDDEKEFYRILDEAVKVQHSALVYRANENTVDTAYTAFKASGKDKKFMLKFEPVK
jgi:hypothetical protein